MSSKLIYTSDDHLYCVYLIVYKGNKLPPFYIGSTTIRKITRRYYGSVNSAMYRNIWKSELENNKHLFDRKIIKTFKSRNEAYDYEQLIQVQYNLVENSLFVNRAIANNKFNMQGCKHTEATKQKMSYSHKSLNRTMSEAERQKLSIANSGTVTIYNEITKKYEKVKNDHITKEKVKNKEYSFIGNKRDKKSRAKTAEVLKDTTCYHDPITLKVVYIKPDKIPPEGYIKGLPENKKQELREHFIDCQFYYNPITGESFRFKPDNVPEGFIKGRKNFGKNGNFFEHNVLGIDIRTKLKSSIDKNNTDRKFIINYNSTIIFKYKNTYSTRLLDFKLYLNSQEIICTQETLQHIKKSVINPKTKILLDYGVEIISIDDYQYEIYHEWL